MKTIVNLFVPELSPAAKHSTIFKKFDELEPGQSLQIINDHDPIPLFYEMKEERGDTFQWKKIEDGPEVWRVEISKTSALLHVKTSTFAALDNNGEDEFILKVSDLEPRLKHPTIFKYFDALQAGESFQILNDHDPKPLYYQMIAERGNIFSWQYLKKGPEHWQVRIKKNEAGETIGEIAAKDLRKAEVFKKYGIDFCCGGKKTLKDACEEARVDLKDVEAALAGPLPDSSKTGMDFNLWEPDFLADYIYNQHHKYYYNEDPVIADLTDKVVARHGNHHPALKTIKNLYQQLQQELHGHFLKEERVLFPFIKALVRAKNTGDFSELNSFPSIKEPIQIMEMDHEGAGEILAKISSATNKYTPPADACNSFQLLYKKLGDLEADLHMHIHLENNILFPKALALEKEVMK